jgi:cytochrome c553
MMRSTWRGWLTVVALLAAAVVVVAWIAYEKLWREEPQPDWILQTTAGEFGDTQFKYRSFGTEENGVPYWIFYVLPMIFSDKLPGLGGYTAFGLPWEPGVELPIGMTKRTIGYPRVGITCALCHTTRYRKQAETKPVFVPAGPGHTANAEALSRFFYECALDPRFDAGNLLSQIERFTKLDPIDKLLYRFVIIPGAKKRILDGGENFLWTYRKPIPAWGRGSDGPLYSSRFLASPRLDGRYGSAQFPAVWNLAKYQKNNDRGESQHLNATGDGQNAESVVHDSLIGMLGPDASDNSRVKSDAKALADYLLRKPAQPFPFDEQHRMQSDKVESGKKVFDQHCAACHGEGNARVGQLVPVAEVGTDPDYVSRWNNANRPNYVPSYVAPHLDGIWLRGPYLHNGSVPTMRDLLKRARERPSSFYRGADVLDFDNLGFISQGDDAVRRGALFDTTKKGNGNQGHEYGVDLSDDEKNNLIEYMKTL